VTRPERHWLPAAIIALLSLNEAHAGPLGIAPSDGTVATGVTAPAWVDWGTSVDTGVAFAASARELDEAWALRRSLENDAAKARVDALIAGLRPTLDLGQRDLLQRALFLRGVLATDDAGGFESLEGAVSVEGQKIPRDWVDAIAVSPGASAPATLDADFSARIYDDARTRLVARGGATVDLAFTGAGEVRVDGAPVRLAITLLPGVHTLSWHPPGQPPVALQFNVGAPGEPNDTTLTARLTHLEQVHRGEAELSPSVRAELRRHLDSPAMILEGEGPPRTVWLVDGPARWGPMALGFGLSTGGQAFVGTYAPTPDRCGIAPEVDAPTKGLGGLTAEGTAEAGPWRARVGLGAAGVLGADDTFAVAGSGACANGVPDATAGRRFVPYGWASVGRRVPLAAGRELEPFVRVGTLTVYALAQAGLGMRVVSAGPVQLDVRAQGGVAFNVWSGEGNAAGFLGGLETALTWRAR
jgi:hypothetical protein